MGKCESGSSSGGGQPLRGAGGGGGQSRLTQHIRGCWGAATCVCGYVCPWAPCHPSRQAGTGVPSTPRLRAGTRVCKARGSARCRCTSRCDTAQPWQQSFGVKFLAAFFSPGLGHPAAGSDRELPCPVPRGSPSAPALLESRRRKQGGCCTSPFPNLSLLATQSASPIAELPEVFGQPGSEHS